MHGASSFATRRPLRILCIGSTLSLDEVSLQFFRAIKPPASVITESLSVVSVSGASVIVTSGLVVLPEPEALVSRMLVSFPDVLLEALNFRGVAG